MRFKFLLLIPLLVGVCRYSSAQSDLKILSRDSFQEIIINQWWSCENQENKTECDMRLLIIKPQDLELNCVNWTNGFLGGKCPYTLTVKDNFFELNLTNCPNKFDAACLYGYLSKTEQLFLLISKKTLALNSGILAEKEWLKFEKITR